jgi:chromosome segregation ATPase
MTTKAEELSAAQARLADLQNEIAGAEAEVRATEDALNDAHASGNAVAIAKQRKQLQVVNEKLGILRQQHGAAKRMIVKTQEAARHSDAQLLVDQRASLAEHGARLVPEILAIATALEKLFGQWQALRTRDRQAFDSLTKFPAVQGKSGKPFADATEFPAQLMGTLEQLAHNMQLLRVKGMAEGK